MINIQVLGGENFKQLFFQTRIDEEADVRVSADKSVFYNFEIPEVIEFLISWLSQLKTTRAAYLSHASTTYIRFAVHAPTRTFARRITLHLHCLKLSALACASSVGSTYIRVVCCFNCQKPLTVKFPYCAFSHSRDRRSKRVYEYLLMLNAQTY